MFIILTYLLILGGLFSCGNNPEIPIVKNERILIPMPPQEITIIFGGDVMMHTPQISAAKDSLGKYDFNNSFMYIKDYWKDADAVILNLETTLTDSCFSGYPTFASPYSIAQNLKDNGVTHFVTANNHTCDQHGKGIDKTIDFLDNINIWHTGSFKDSIQWRTLSPLYIKKDSFNIALLNYTYGTNGIRIPKGKVVQLIDTTQISIDIFKAKQDNATNIIVFLHWGEEYARHASKEQILLASWLREKGVDIIIGSHPHVVQRAECDSSGVIVYSLGNFISNQRKRYSNGGINTKLTLSRYNNKTKYYLSYRSYYVHKTDITPRYFCVDESTASKVIINSWDQRTAKEFFDDTRKIMEGINAE